MNITLSTDSILTVSADLLAIGVGGKKPLQHPSILRLDKAMGGTLVAYLKDEDFKAKEGQTLRMLSRGKLKAKRLLFVGLGDADVPTRRALRRFAIESARAGGAKGASLAITAPAADDETLRALADGLTTGSYRYTRYFTGDRAPKHSLKRVAVLVDKKPGPSARAAIAAGQGVGEVVNLARDLVNTPANDLTATGLANVAAAEAKNLGLECKVFDKKGIEKLGLPLLLAVNRGSAEEPRFIHMSYKPKKAGGDAPKKVVFVGKGLTFDSGGLCLKPADAMMDMKADMAGAAATIGIVLAAAKLELPIEVHGVIASTDNMTGGNAYRPGDVFPSRDGKTVEIINTDAEGRLVLADALAYARDLEPDYLIDHATLTGACMVALGNFRAGLFSNDDALRAAYEKAAALTGEQFWAMPLDEDLRDQLKSGIADLKHTGSRYGGSITAAMSRCIHPKGGTGFGVLTAVEFLRTLSTTP
jgi:leucyl aminopeptidase